MTRLVSLIVLLLFLPGASVLAGDLPQVLQPNTTAYSASEITALTQAIATLTVALNDYDMALRRFFSASDWSSRDFAMYTAGVLSGKGYETKIVGAHGWPDSLHLACDTHEGSAFRENTMRYPWYINNGLQAS